MSAQKRLLSPIKANNNLDSNKKQKVSANIENPEVEDSLEHFFGDDLFELDIAPYEKKAEAHKLDLTVWQRCTVEKLERKSATYDLLLHVKKENKIDMENSDGTGEPLRATCYLRGIWSNTHVSVGDVVSLRAPWDKDLNAFKIDRDQGYCILNPDLLISGTTVAGSLFCRRKAVLQEHFRSADVTNKAMIVGSIVHELVQKVLSEGINSLQAVGNAANDLMCSKATTNKLYANRLNFDQTKLEVLSLVPNIMNFVEDYVNTKTSKPKPIDAQNFQGTITEVTDIEENLWVPQLGLKGKIDVSVRINRNRRSKLNASASASSQDAIPLELKTGRATFSMEHKGQLILYDMMLEVLGRNTSSTGLLFYLRENTLREVRAGRNEYRDLVSLRNELAYYFSRTINQTALDTATTDEENDKFFQPFELPDPINHHSACSNCVLATICCSFAKTDAALSLSPQHPLVKLMPQAIGHLKTKDYDYFIHWCTMLALEEQNDSKTHVQSALWTEAPAARQAQGRAVVGLRLQPNVERIDMNFVHTFEIENTDMDLRLSGFITGEFVIVSTPKRLAVAAGFIQNFTDSTMTVSLERDLRQNYANQDFIIDKHESQSLQSFNYANLGLLITHHARSQDLREIIIHKRPPRFSRTLPGLIASEGQAIFRELNTLQMKTVVKALATQSFLLIKGLPGTGKTQTLVAIVRALKLLRKSVVIASHTHSAVDNLLLRLKPYNLKMLRLGSSARIHPELEEYAESFITKDCKTVRDLKETYEAYNIIGVTCFGSTHSIFHNRPIDYCIVDEATQVMQPTILRSLFCCSKFVLVGDPDQLPPVVRSREARKRGADISLFQHLDNVASTSILSLQYRMNRTITKLANDLTYGGALKCGTEAVEKATLKPLTLTVRAQWLLRALQAHVDQSVFLLDTGDCATRSFDFAHNKNNTTGEALEQKNAADTASSSPPKLQKRISKYTNYCEAVVVFRIVKTLLAEGHDAAHIGVIAPYRAQVDLLKKLTTQFHDFYEKKGKNLNFNEVEVNTVDQYQGRDKNIIIYSGSKTGTAAVDNERWREAEILEDKRRLTVAITRAKHKLILVADADCLKQYTPFKALFARIPSYCKLRLEDYKLNFEWRKLFEKLTKITSA